MQVLLRHEAQVRLGCSESDSQRRASIPLSKCRKKRDEESDRTERQCSCGHERDSSTPRSLNWETVPQLEYALHVRDRLATFQPARLARVILIVQPLPPLHKLSDELSLSHR
jgi:hypothetical protein